MTGSQFTSNTLAIDTDTSSSFYSPMYLRAYTIGGITFDVPVSIIVCGGETIQSSGSIGPIQATFHKSTGT